MARPWMVMTDGEPTSRSGEERVRLQAPQPRRPLHVAADEWHVWDLPVGGRPRTFSVEARNVDREAAVRALHSHRPQDLGRVDADPGPWPGEPDPVHRHMQAGQQLNWRPHLWGGRHRHWRCREGGNELALSKVRLVPLQEPYS